MARTAKSLTRARDLTHIIREIASSMADGTWRVGESHANLAQREGVELATVRNWAAQASKHLRDLSPTDREELVARNSARLDHATEMAFAAGEARAAVAAVEAQNKLLGLNAPERHEHAHVVAQFEQLPAEAKRAKLLEARARIDEALAALGDVVEST